MPLREEASLVLYLVSPDYALRAGPGAMSSTLDRERIEARRLPRVLLLGRRGRRGRYRTVGTSRAVALASTAPTLEQARARVAECAASVPVLEWRRDVGDERYLEGLASLLAAERRRRAALRRL